MNDSDAAKRTTTTRNITDQCRDLWKIAPCSLVINYGEIGIVSLPVGRNRTIVCPVTEECYDLWGPDGPLEFDMTLSRAREVSDVMYRPPWKP